MASDSADDSRDRPADVQADTPGDLVPGQASSLDQVVARLTSGYRSISEMVYDVIKEAIVSGSFAPGERLPQEELAAAIGVSRIPVRSALIQLDAEGLVTFSPRRGAVVRSLSSAQIREIFELRQLLETYALRKSMETMTPDRAKQILQRASHLDEPGHGEEVVERRRQFYQLLYDAESNPQLVEIIDNLRTKLGRYLLGWRVTSGTTESHAALGQLVAAGDVEAAVHWLTDHLERVRGNMESILAAGPSPAAAQNRQRRVRKIGVPAI
jgi:DNA-binding GntR family transcriptional regulator